LVEDRDPGHLAPLELQAAPQEVRSLLYALNQLLAAVQTSVASQRRFISDAAHQLRTPLAGLKSQTEIALGENKDPRLAPRLQRVHESAVRSAHLVNQLLTLARAEPESAASLDGARTDLQALAAELTAELVPRALQAGIDLGMDEASATAPVIVNGHALLLREALVNVLDNAIRYAGNGADITVRLRTEGRQALLEVMDSGPGLPADQLERVFERFVRATHEGTGCGLGLAIVREIAQRHGGSVSLANRQPHGLALKLVLPLASNS
jgi:two-component system, OmpR family, sensor histidine kinase TctE